MSMITERAYKLGDTLRKRSGSEWKGKVVGFYSTKLTPIGYAIESFSEKGSVQIYPESALELCDPVYLLRLHALEDLKVLATAPKLGDYGMELLRSTLTMLVPDLDLSAIED